MLPLWKGPGLHINQKLKTGTKTRTKVLPRIVTRSKKLTLRRTFSYTPVSNFVNLICYFYWGFRPFIDAINAFRTSYSPNITVLLWLQGPEYVRPRTQHLSNIALTETFYQTKFISVQSCWSRFSQGKKRWMNLILWASYTTSSCNAMDVDS